MVINDSNLINWAENGGMEPFIQNNVQPASIDLTLDEWVMECHWVWKNPVTRWLAHTLGMDVPLFTKKRPFKQLTLWPGQFVLLSSAEHVSIPKTDCAILLSKSSTGRKGLEHSHAGWIDPGFNGKLTFEITNVSQKPVTIKPGDALVQVVMMRLVGKSGGYNGRYQNQSEVTAAR